MKVTRFLSLIVVTGVLFLLGNHLPYSSLDWVAFGQPYPPPCAVTVAMEGESSAELDLRTLQNLRDEILATRPAGQKYTDLYYQHTGELVHILLSDPGLRRQTAMLLQDAMPGIRGLLGEPGGQAMILSTDRLKQIEGLLDDYARYADPELQSVLEDMRKLLRSLEGQTFEEAWQSMSAAG